MKQICSTIFVARLIGLAFADAPKPMLGGFDAIVVRFSLRDAPNTLAGPLVLRLFTGPVQPGRAAREAAVQNALATLGYRAPRALVAEPDGAALGNPFLIMECLPGITPGAGFESLRLKGVADVIGFVRQVPRLRRDLLSVWAEAQQTLHALPVRALVAKIENAGTAAETLMFPAALSTLDETVKTLGLEGLQTVMRWLLEQRPDETSAAVICHGDLQPFNLLADRGRLTGVLDWARATIADPALDYGAALAIFSTVPIRVPTLLRGVIRAFLIGLAQSQVRSFVTEKRQADAVRYYQVFNCMIQLTAVARSRAQGRMTQGAYNSDVGIANLTRHIQRVTGLDIVIPDALRSDRQARLLSNE